MSAAPINPGPASLELVGMGGEEGHIVIEARARRPAVPCPGCGRLTTRVHSRYRRTLADLPWQGNAVRIVLHTRRWRCGTPGCPRLVFTERLPGVAARYARQTDRCAEVVTALAFALGGEGGARLLARLGIARSPDALLDAIRAAADPPPAAPEVVGIDDWSWRRGHRFGTIIVDLARRRVVDLLEGRSADAVAAWLRRYPGITAIARDRGGIYAEGARTGAPQAAQVADRWHLLRNLTEVLEELLLHQRAALRDAAARMAAPPTGEPAAEPSAAGVAGPLTPHRPRHGHERAEEASRRRHARLVEQYEAIRRLHDAGADVADIARRVGASHRTAYRYRALPEPPAPKRPHRPPRRRVLDPYEPYLLRRWQEGCRNGVRRWREIRDQGFAHSVTNVARFAAQLRRDEADGCPEGASRRAKATPTPTARHVAGLFLRRPADLTEEEQAYLNHLRQLDATAATAYRLTQDFAAMVRERRGERLDDWLAEAEAGDVPALRRFAIGLRADLDAVRAGLTEEWSNEYVA